MVFWFLEKNKWVSLGFGIVGVLIFAVATFKILTTNLDKLVMRVTIGYGLWLLLVGYLGIGLVCLGNFIPLLKGKK
jgi:hypothetical protein